MADNVVANPGAGGATFATDDIAGVQHPYAKLEWGPADTANIVDDASGKRVPVKVGDPLPAGTNNIGDVDIVTVPAPLSTTGGGTEATALRVTVATDSTGVLSVDDNGASLTIDNAALAVTGGGVEASALRVTIATDSTGVLSVDDNGGSLTVDGTVAISGAVDTELTTADLDTGAGTDTRAVVGLVLAASGGGLLVGAANPVPVSDNGGSLTVDGTITANAGTNLNTSALALEAGGNLATLTGKDFSTQTTLATRLSESDFDTKTGALTETAPATDTASSGLNGRLQRLAQRLTSLIALLPSALVSGRLDVNLGAAPAAVTVNGDVASDGVDSGNPVKIGYQGRTTDITPVASADRVNAIADTLGKQIILQGAVHDLHKDGRNTYTTTTAADVIATAGVGVRIAVTSVLVTNAHATVGTKVEIRDGTTVKIQGQAAAGGGGFAYASGGRPLFITTANTAVTARCVTTGADVDVHASGYSIAN